MSASEKKCPFCAELIKSEAIKCKHCGSFVDEAAAAGGASTQAPKSRAAEAWLFALLIGIPFILGGLMLAWFNSLPPGERERIERQAR